MNVQVGILKLINLGNRELSVMYDTEQIWMVEFAYVYTAGFISLHCCESMYVVAWADVELFCCCF